MFGFGKIKETPVVYTLFILCLLVSIPSAFNSEYYQLFSGELPHEFWWQNFSMALQHGVKDMPLIILTHLFLNMFLLLTCGKMVEIILGSYKFIILSLIAWGGFILTQKMSGIWVNGASGIIWAYSPFLILLFPWARDNVKFRLWRDRARFLLILMWGITTLFMGFLPILFNPEHGLLYSFFFGNLFHASATLLGFIILGFMKAWIKKPESLS